MKTRPIIFNTEMVQAILDGIKTQTRRVVDQVWQGYAKVSKHSSTQTFDFHFPEGGGALVACPHGNRGDLMYARETWAIVAGQYRYRADGDWTTEEKEMGEFARWKPSIHMPKDAARIWLRVKDVRVERVQDISQEDAIAEGINLEETSKYFCPGEVFAELWDSINGKRGAGWDKNPFVWVIEFDVLSTTGKPRQ